MSNRSDRGVPEAIRFFDHLVAVFAGPKRHRRGTPAERPGSTEFQPGRDPRALGNVIRRTIDDHGWAAPLARVSIIEDWVDVVGSDVAAHSTPELADEVLLVSCDSSAWATQLRMLRHDILREIESRFPDSGITEISVLGPGVPTQISGHRRVKWRGPRDTYG